MPVLNDRLEPDRAEQHAAVAFRLMQQQGIAPTPPNYTVWYHFVSEDHPDLRREMQENLATQAAATSDITLDLYEKHFDVREERRKLETATVDFLQRMGSLSDTLGEARDEYQLLGDSMQYGLDRIGEATSREELQELVISLVRESVRAQALNNVLFEELTQATEEVEAIKDDLIELDHGRQVDSLTGLANRDRFLDMLDRRISEARANAQSVSIAVIDIDDFKAFNLAHGSQLGDQVIRLIGGELARSSKDRDVPCRFGGQEFAVLFDSTSLPDARDRADALRSAVTSRRIKRKGTGEDLGRVTLSIGIAGLTAADSAEKLVERARAELYTAKKTGKNKVSPSARGIERSRPSAANET